MNRALIVIGLLALIFPAGLHAQDDGPPIIESSTGNFFGVGARGIGMGGAQIASSMDGTALVYNPALLARIRRLEFLAGLSHQNLSNERNSIPATSSGVTVLPQDGRSKTFTNLNALNLTVPVPTYRGSAVLAFGINRVMSFDQVFQFARAYFADDSREIGTETATGGVLMYTAGGALDLSPRVSIGAALNLYHGSEDYTWEYVYLPNDGPNERFRQYITADYTGVSAKVGMALALSPNTTVGIAVESPIDFSIDGEYVEDEVYTPDFYEYELRHPFTFGGGVSWRNARLKAALDLTYIDWTQLKYTEYADLAFANRLIDQYYRETLRINAGLEYLLPWAGTKARIGYIYDPIPYADFLVDNDREFITLGFGLLIDRVITLDFAFVHGSYSFTAPVPDAAGNFDVSSASFEEYKVNRIFVTTAFRL